MEIRLTFHEIKDYIASHYGKDFEFRAISNKTLLVRTTVKVLFFSKSVGLNITIGKVVDKDIVFYYDNGFITKMIVKSGLEYLKKTQSEFFSLLEEQSNSIVLHLWRIKRLESVFNFIRLENMVFGNEIIILQASVR